MITRRQSRHFVAIDGIVVVEAFDLVGHFAHRVLVFPVVEESLEHAEGAEFVFFTQTTEDAEFGVGHAHVGFVGLDVGFCYWFQFGGRGGVWVG